MAAEDSRSPKNPQNPSKRSAHSAGSEIKECILSPRFRSAAAMAGWDEEALLLASLVVEDTPVRESRHKKRPNQQSKSPTGTNSNRKRRSRRRSSNPIPAVVLHLDDDTDDANEDVAVKKDMGKKREEMESAVVDEEKKMQGKGAPAEKTSDTSLACMDRLREELSCAICLEICFEPSTTPCGHSFCKKCLKCAASKCGKRCPKCRQLISNPRSCTVNTVLWNTIQLLFPGEVEERKKAVVGATSRSDEARSQSPDSRDNNRSSSTRSATQVSRAVDHHRSIRRRTGPIQSEDAALALRLQREEFMEAFQDTREQRRDTTRANLRVIAARSIYIRHRDRST